MFQPEETPSSSHFAAPITPPSEGVRNGSSQTPHPSMLEASQVLYELRTTAGQNGSVVYNNDEELEPPARPQLDMRTNPQHSPQTPLQAYQGQPAPYQLYQFPLPDLELIPEKYRENPQWMSCYLWIQSQQATQQWVPSQADPKTDSQASQYQVPANPAQWPYLPNPAQPAVTKKIYVCEVCSHRFARPSALNTHIRTHTGEKPFACSFEGCGARFNVKSNCTRHEIAKHGVNPAKPKSPTPMEKRSAA